ncbi:transposase [Streptomyces goshikiensis]
MVQAADTRLTGSAEVSGASSGSRLWWRAPAGPSSRWSATRPRATACAKASGCRKRLSDHRIVALVVRDAQLSDAGWAVIAPLLPLAGRAHGRWRDHRQVLEGIVFKFRTGTPWRDLPDRFGRSTDASPAGPPKVPRAVSWRRPGPGADQGWHRPPCAMREA